jgi:ABC-type sugar transport system ATPase subunit
MQGIEMEFPGVKALDNVDFELEKGEIHAIVGANGAGKSTLAKILGGYYPKYKGRVLIDGHLYRILSPRDSLHLGIASISQETNLVPEFSISANIFLGREIKRQFSRFIDRSQMKNLAEGLLRKYGMDIDPEIKAKELRVVEQQVVDIIKAIERRASILIMDEPTSVLSFKETRILFDIIKELKKDKVSIIFISHRLEDIFEISDRVTVLRDGKKVFTGIRESLTVDRLISFMVGEKVCTASRKSSLKKAENVLMVEKLTSKGFSNVSFELSAGEVLGVVGGPDSGKGELLRTLYGVNKPKSGIVRLKKKTIHKFSPRSSLNLGIGLLTEDRRKDGLFPLMSVAINIVISFLSSLSDFGIIKWKKVYQLTENMIAELSIKSSSLKQHIGTLSGGNQQKAILARLICMDSSIYLLEEPTRGVDIRGKDELLRIIEDQKNKGKCGLLISSEFSELIRICDRIMAMENGRIIMFYSPDELTEKKLIELNFMESEKGIYERTAH